MTSPWHRNAGKRLIKSPKTYVRDSGLVHALLGIGDAEQLAGRPIVGASWEGLVIESLIGAAPPETEPSFYRSSAGAEIDLVLAIPGGRLWAVEVKRSLTPKPRRASTSRAKTWRSSGDSESPAMAAARCMRPRSAGEIGRCAIRRFTRLPRGVGKSHLAHFSAAGHSETSEKTSR